MRTITISSVLFLGIVAACNQPGAAVGSAAQALTAAELGSALAGGAQSVEIDLDASLVAREVELEAIDEEQIEAPLLAVDPAGAVTVDLGALVVDFDAATRFRLEDDSNVDLATWTAAAQAALAVGPVYVRASRPLPAAPSDPADASFAATELRLEGALEESKLELLLDADNFALQGDGGTLKVLGLEIQVTSDSELWSDDVDGESDDSGDDSADDASDDSNGAGGDDSPDGAGGDDSPDGAGGDDSAG